MSELSWNVKASLLAYVRGMGDGQVSTVSPARFVGDTVFFPGDGASFSGALALLGHGGLLQLTFADPRVEPIGAGWRITIEDPYAPGSRMTLASVGALLDEPGGVRRGSGVALTAEGADLFLGPYTEGTPLDDFLIGE